MNNKFINYACVPSGALLEVSEQERSQILDQIVLLPFSIRNLVSAPQTGAFIRGLSRTYNIDLQKAPKIAFAVLQIAIGEKTLAQLASILSTELPTANDVAQKMANEIEKELFAPVALELNQYLAQKKQAGQGIMSQGARQVAQQAGGARNVLNLREQLKPPLPPAIPNRSFGIKPQDDTM